MTTTNTNNTNIREAVNIIALEGTVAEVRIEEKVINSKPAISGEVDIKVADNEIHTVSMFAYKEKNDGTENGLFKGIQTIADDYKSIAKDGEELADKVRVSSGKLGLNEYFGKDGQLKSFPKINSNFVTRLKPTDNFEPKATFETEIFVRKVTDELNKEGTETGRVILEGIIPLFGGKVIPMKFVVDGEQAIKFVVNNYEPATTVKISGDIINNVKIEEIEEEVAFGSPRKKIKKHTTREYIVTAGDYPYEETNANAYDVEKMKQAMVERETFLDELEAKSKKASASSANGFDTKSGANASAGATKAGTGKALPF